MRLTHWLRPLTARSTRKPVRRTPPRPTFRPRVEGLEDRTTPSTPGEFDPSFGVNGAVTTDFNGTADYATNLAVQPNDGKIIVVGYTTSETTEADVAVARYNANGTLDTTFGTDPGHPGWVVIDLGSPEDLCVSVTVLPDGEILLAGTTSNVDSGLYDFAVARLTTHGALDPNFGGDGLVTVSFDGIGANPSRWNVRALAQGDKIIVSGGLNGNHGLVRLNGTDGSVDTYFGDDGTGRVIIPVGGWYNQADAVVQPNGKIVVAGERGLVLRFDSGGRPDSTFVQQTLDFSTYGMSLDVEGNVLLAGRDDFNGFKPADLFVARLKGGDGSLDPTFGTGGEVRIDLGSSHEVATSLAVQADGRILVFGTFWEQDEYEQDSTVYQAVVRLTTGGGLDGSFGSGGSLLQLLPDWFGPPAVHPDGSILSTNAYPQPGTDYDFVLTRRVGVTDADGDGIDDFVDPEPAVFSNTFSDGTTTGSIVSRGDQTLTIVNSLDPTQGVVITASESGGTTPAEISVDSGTSSVFLSPGDRITLTHGSVIVHVLTGIVEATFVADSGAVTTTSLTSGNAVTFKPETGVVTADATNTQPVVVTTNGTVVTVKPGASAPTAIPTVTVTGGSFVYDGQVRPASGSVTGTGGEDLGDPTITYYYRDEDGHWHLTGNGGADVPTEPGYYKAVASFAGTDDYQSATAEADITIAYEARSLTDLSKAFKAGRAIPIKLMLLDADGNNISSPDTDVTAVRLERVNADGSRTEVELDDSGGSNPGGLFRYDAALGGYIFNLSTKDLAAGTYAFTWTAEGDPTEHELGFKLS